MTRKYFDEFYSVDTSSDLERFKEYIATIRYNGFSSVRQAKNGRFICGLHVDSNKRLAASSATKEMAELAYIAIQERIK
ncbi:hypothetical protein [Acinetobacter sp. 'aerobic (ED)']|uniref:hypothetical protein n=1 Tax=Acinetobacter sp. 'aerobic (ED)' TaxID=174230 RepID=UPI00192C4213|nr:hypothetical protein [Acinetobacter sp. 'aerobic (ED)']